MRGGLGPQLASQAAPRPHQHRVTESARSLLHNTQVPLAKRASIQQSGKTLFRFQQRLSALGYDTYLIHARPSKEAGASRGVHARDVTLVPVYGNFWHDDYEICFDRKVAYGRYTEWCWNDLFVVRRCNKCVKRTMLKALQGGRQLFPSCDCL